MQLLSYRDNEWLCKRPVFSNLSSYMRLIKITLPGFSRFIVALLTAAFSLTADAATEPETGAEAEHEVVVYEEPKRNTVYFPQFQLFETVKNEVEMSDEISGRLELIDECLRVVTTRGSFLIIWPGWYDFAVDGREIVVTKINTGEEVASLKVGQRINLSGAELVYYPAALQYKIPDQCLGPYLAVGTIDSVTEYQNFTESRPIPKKVQKITKNDIKPLKMPSQPKKIVQKRVKSSEPSGNHLRKLEIMLEKTILK